MINLFRYIIISSSRYQIGDELVLRIGSSYKECFVIKVERGYDAEEECRSTFPSMYCSSEWVNIGDNEVVYFIACKKDIFQYYYIPEHLVGKYVIRKERQ